uniref:centromere protein S-like isoform X4 n=1 Tax=Myxine glutinosa TaxID=7769 RepID=UPI00358E1CF7
MSAQARPGFSLPSARSRLRAAMHFTVGKLCEKVANDEHVSFSKQAVAAIAETTFRQCELFTRDVEMFAKHAKRTTVNCDDVKLLSRRSKSLHNFISKRSEELTMVNREMRGKKKRRTTKAVASKHKQEDDDQDGEADACTFPV